MNLIEKAKEFATKAHEGQTRKFGPEPRPPYIVHPERVATRVASLPRVNEVDIAAAWLHDVIEDCGVTYETMAREFGVEVADLVQELTNPTDAPEWKDRPRLWKRGMEWMHLIDISDRAKRIKMCDRIDNLRDVSTSRDNKWLQKYTKESRILSKLVGDADPVLEKELNFTIMQIELFLAEKTNKETKETNQA